MSDLFHLGVPDGFILKAFDAMRATPWHTYQVLTKRTVRMVDFMHDSTYDQAGIPPNIWCGTSVEDRKRTTRIDQLRDCDAAVRFLSVEPLLESLGVIDLTGIDWVIVGGESGAGARPMEPKWVRDIRRAAFDHGAKFFFKQWGGVRKKEAGRLLDGRYWNEMPEIAELEVPSRSHRKSISESLRRQWAADAVRSAA